MPTVAPLDLDGHVIAAAFLGDVPFFATASGAIHRLDHGQKVTEAHDGLLACVRDEANDTLITGGEDGKVQRIAADGTDTLLAEVPRKEPLVQTNVYDVQDKGADAVIAEVITNNAGKHL